MGKNWYYWVEDDEGKQVYLDTPEQFLEYLQGNDPTTCGADLMTPDEFEALDDVVA